MLQGHGIVVVWVVGVSYVPGSMGTVVMRVLEGYCLWEAIVVFDDEGQVGHGLATFVDGGAEGSERVVDGVDGGLPAVSETVVSALT